LYGLEHPVEAFLFDRAVFLFGSSLEADVSDHTKNVKKRKEEAEQRRIMVWLDEDGSMPGRFASPAAPTRRRGNK
jgi:hypothetical protein